ncbi:MAG: tetratricopeptide repeat protein [Acidobacteria bacterium]|nr:tetratricopeptide repeat protein [Acidobacteriota bacterium]
MYTLVSFATQWGSKYGGINSFNTDLLTAFSIAYHKGSQVICVVSNASEGELEEAAKAHVRLVPLPDVPATAAFGHEDGEAGAKRLVSLGIECDPDRTVWLGHDRITGAAAVAAAKAKGGRSAVIHHMSYDHYESVAEDSQSAERRSREQSNLFQSADIVLAVGPLLRDALMDLVKRSKTAHMLIPGLAEIDAQEVPKTFSAFLSGRLSDDAARIKQANLGIAAFATAQKEARESEMPDALRRQPKLVLRGVDFEGRAAKSASGDTSDPETELKRLAAELAGGIVNLHALPYTYDRRRLYEELSRSSVALMPSWHEGFGLVGWEAIAAGVPLILTKSSGVYQLLEERWPGAEVGSVYPIDVRGSVDAPFYHDDDLKATVARLKEIAKDPGKARQRASRLKNDMGEVTWAACAEQVAGAFEWKLAKGSRPAVVPSTLPQPEDVLAPAAPAAGRMREPLLMPVGHWRAGAGMADSQLLRAEEALLPFDLARQPDIDRLNEWLDDEQWPQAVRLMTGAGGQGKTRLALEICQQRLKSGWQAGFLDSELEANRMGGIWQELRRLNRPLLIVVDYAETRQAAFLSILKAALQNPGEHPLRMLLLARDAGEWWDNLPGKDSQCEALLSGLATSGPFRLPALYVAQSDRHEAYAKALRAFAEALGGSAPEVVPDLLGDHFERPLYVQMAALLALYGEGPTTAQGLTKALLHHEGRYWRGILAPFEWPGPEPERHAEQLLALSTLAGGFATPRAAEAFWTRAKGDVLNSAEFGALFRAMATLYPGTQGLQALRPDLLGEALVAQALLRSEADTLLDSVLSNTAAQTSRRNALTVIARVSQQRPDLHETLVEAFVRHFIHCYQEIIAVSTETVSRLPALAEEAFTRLPPGNKSQTAGLLWPFLEEESVQLAGLRFIVSAYLVEKAKEKFEKKPGNTERMAEYGGRLVDYAVSQRRIGHLQQALEVSRSNVKLYEQLMVKDPRRFEQGYARVLSNYSIYLSDMGNKEEAVPHARQAMEIHRRLSQKSPERFERDYTMSLNNYSTCLVDIGNYSEALDCNRKALEIRERLAQKKPDIFEPDYANTLNNHALCLSDVGQYEEALEYASRSLEIRERLARKNPDRFAEDLFNTSKVVSFLSWLCHQEEPRGNDNLAQLLTFMAPHRRPLMLHFAAFAEACWSTGQAERAAAFQRALITWNDLSAPFEGDQYGLCAAAWLSKFGQGELVAPKWEEKWRQFAKERNGNVPQWMLEVARRLDFEWPDFSGDV